MSTKTKLTAVKSKVLAEMMGAKRKSNDAAPLTKLRSKLKPGKPGADAAPWGTK